MLIIILQSIRVEANLLPAPIHNPHSDFAISLLYTTLLLTRRPVNIAKSLAVISTSRPNEIRSFLETCIRMLFCWNER